MEIKELIGEYQNMKLDIVAIEKEIEEKFRLFEKKQTITMARNFDHGQKGFVMNMLFDEINVMALGHENVEGLKFLLTKYNGLREKQKKIEDELKEKSAIMKQNKESIGGRII